MKFLITQDVEDEVEAGMRLLDELTAYAATFKRQTVDASSWSSASNAAAATVFPASPPTRLWAALPTCWRATRHDAADRGCRKCLAPETILMDRCKDEATFRKAVDLINNFKEYFIRHGQRSYENPSPGNKAGGITTLEDKSLGCTQKGGTAEVARWCSAIAEPVTEKGPESRAGAGQRPSAPSRR